MTLRVLEQDAAVLHRPLHLDNDAQHVVDYMLLVARRPPNLDSPDEGASSDEGVSVENVKFLARHFTSIANSTARVGLGFSGAFVTLNDCEPDTCTNRDPCTKQCLSGGSIAVPENDPCQRSVTAMPFTGTHSVTNSTFDGPGIGVEAMGWTKGTLTVGGSAAEGNRFVWGNHGVAIVDHDDSSFEISHNVVNFRRVGIGVAQRNGRPRRPNDRDEPFFKRVLVRSTATVTENSVTGIENSRGPGIRIRDYGHLENPPIRGNQRVVVTHNDIMGSWAAADPYAVGIYDMGKSDFLMGNTIMMEHNSATFSAAKAAIWLSHCESCSVLWNNVINVTPLAEWGQISLTQSKNCTVLVCDALGNDVMVYPEELESENVVRDWCGPYLPGP
jgi:hypothetical protein